MNANAIEASILTPIQAWATEPQEQIIVEAQPVEQGLASERSRVFVANLTPADKALFLKIGGLSAGSFLLSVASKVSLFALKALPWCVFLAKSPLGDSFRKIVPFSFLAFPTIQSTLICLTVCTVTALACNYLSSRCFTAAFDAYRNNHAAAQKTITFICEEFIRRYNSDNNTRLEDNHQIIGANPIEVAALILDVYFLSRFTHSFTPEQQVAFSRICRQFESECLTTPTEGAGIELFNQLTQMRDTLLQTP